MRDSKRNLVDWLSERLNLTEIFSLLTSYGLFYAELDTRKPLREALAEASRRPLPSYARWPRVLGLLAVVLLALEIVTGCLLSLYYLPTVQDAHGSVGTILRDVHFGWLIHQIHFWGGQLLLAVLVLRLGRFFLQRIYQAPKELVWICAVLLLIVGIHLDLTGRLLPMTGTAYWSTVRALEVVEAIPLYGSLILFLAGAGQAVVTDLTLIRFYVLHVAILPLVALLLIYLHFSSVRRVGLTGDQPHPDQAPRGRFAISNHLANLAIVLVLLTGAVLTLAVLVPLPFSGPADSFDTVAGIGPPWYLLGPFGFLELTAGVLPIWLAGALVFLAVVGVLALPLFDRTVEAGGRRTLVRVLGVLLVLAWVLLSFYGARTA